MATRRSNLCPAFPVLLFFVCGANSPPSRNLEPLKHDGDEVGERLVPSTGPDPGQKRFWPPVGSYLKKRSGNRRQSRRRLRPISTTPRDQNHCSAWQSVQSETYLSTPLSL